MAVTVVGQQASQVASRWSGRAKGGHGLHAGHHPRALDPKTGPSPTVFHAHGIWGWLLRQDMHEKFKVTEGGTALRSRLTSSPAEAKPHELLTLGHAL